MATIVIDGREVIDVDADPDTPSNVADAHLLVKDLAGGCKVNDQIVAARLRYG